MTLNYETDLRLIVSNKLWPAPSYGGYKLVKRKLNAYAERTATTMRIESIGDTYELTLTFPPIDDESVYKMMIDSLESYIVDVEFYNVFTGTRMISQFYHSDIELVRVWRHIHEPFSIVFIGTEVF